MKPEIISIRKTGTSHISQGKKCEDAFCISDDRTVLCVADGVSNAASGGVGAQYLTTHMCKILEHPEAKKILEEKSNETIRDFVYRNIEKTINSLAEEQNKNPDDFASTFLALVRTSERCLVVIHAGDGAVFAKPNNRQTENAVMVLSYPDCYSGAVYPAAHYEQKNLMRVLRINPDDYCGVMLCTDGFSDAFIDNETRYLNGDDLSVIFYLDSADDFDCYIKNYHLKPSYNITDDITCVYYKMFESEGLTTEALSDSRTSESAVMQNNAQLADAKNISDAHMTVKQAESGKNNAIKEKHKKKDEKTNFKVSSADSAKRSSRGSSKQTDVSMVAAVIAILAVILSFLTIFSVSGKIEDLKKQNEKMQEELSMQYENYKDMKDDIADVNDEIYSLEQFHAEEQSSENPAYR